MRNTTRKNMKPTKDMKDIFNYLKEEFGHFMIIAVKPGEMDEKKGLGVQAFCAGFGNMDLVTDTFLSVEESKPFMNSLKNTQLKKILSGIYSELTEAPIKGKTKKTKKAK